MFPRVSNYWPTEREQAELANQIAEEYPTLGLDAALAELNSRCSSWAEDAAAEALSFQHDQEDEEMDSYWDEELRAEKLAHDNAWEDA